jgi:hypothetical protein
MRAVADYAEFRMVVSPDLASPGSWSVTVEKAPVAGFAGPKGSVVSTLTREQLNTLRSRNGWPNPAVLKQIGTAVRQSIFTATAEAAFTASLDSVAQQQRGLRFVLVLQGQENDVVDTNRVRLSEVPIEVLYNDVNQFFATDLATPISRSGQWQPDRPPQRVVLPLRVLVAIASPTDKPPAQMATEVAAIKKVVEPLTANKVLQVDFVQQATRSEVAAKLNDKPYDVLHFIGHGGFDVVGDVDAPRAHLCFQRPDGRSDPTDADTFTVMLRNSSVRLLVITACSSAAPTPPVPGDPVDSGPLGTSAFEGVAQRAVAGVSGVTAAVAMQFDLEDVGAVEFSRAFYTNLTKPGLALDEIVTLARRALVLHLQAGHRAWVTPAVYWRCEGGKVFEIEPLAQPLDAATLQRLQGVNLQLATYRDAVEKILAQPPELRAPLDDLRRGWITEMERLLAERSNLLGDAIEIRGARAPAGQVVTCRLSLRLRTAATIDLIHFRLEYPAGDISFVDTTAGADAPLPPAVARLDHGKLLAVLVTPSGGTPWPAGEHDLGSVRFAVPPGAPAKVIDIRLTTPHVAQDGQPPLAVTPADGILFVD